MNHHIFSRRENKWKTYDVETHSLVFSREARNNTIVDGQYYHYGNCPPGEYRLGGVYKMDTQPFGPFFIAIDDPNGNWDQYGRAGIGVHGGGSCVEQWSIPMQGWCRTEGCIRFQNHDLVELVQKYYHPGDRLTAAT